MTYVRNGTRAHLDALRVRQQIAAAEVEKAERDLAELQEIERNLLRLQQRKEHIAKELRRTRERTTTTRVQLALPAPQYGGREGLLAAVREASEWDKKRKKEMA